MNSYIKNFFNLISKPEFFNGKIVLEIGSRNVNGSLRSIIENYEPLSYTGIDIIDGEGVDIVCDANELLNQFDDDSVDVIICTELLEHVKNWKNVINNIKQVLKADGIAFITTRSKGFGYHGFPNDYWRYEIIDFQHIFSDFDIICLAKDTEMPGILFLGRKPASFKKADLKKVKLWSIIKRRRKNSVSRLSISLFLRLLPLYKNYLMPLLVKPIRKISNFKSYNGKRI